MQKFMYAVDGMRIAIRAPKGRKDLYNMKDKGYRVIALVATTAKGDLAWVSDTFQNQNEMKIVAESNCRQLLIDAGGGVVADAGFSFNSKMIIERHGEILTAWTMGPLALKRSKKVMQDILNVLHGEYGPIDMARGKLLERIGFQVGTQLHNTRLVSSFRIVSENAILHLRFFRILNVPYRAFIHEGTHLFTVSINDMVKIVAFFVRFIQTKRQVWPRKSTWQSKYKDDPYGYIALPEFPTAAKWQARVKSYGGNDGHNTRAVDVETGSDLFIKLWEILFPDDADWKKYEKDKYTMSEEFNKRFDKWLPGEDDDDELVYVEDEEVEEAVAVKKKSLDIENELLEEIGNDLIAEDPFSILFATLPHRRVANMSAWEDPMIAYRGPVHENIAQEELDKLDINFLLGLIMFVANDITHGRVKAFYDGVCIFITSDDFKHNDCTKLMSTMRGLFNTLTLTNARKAIQKKLNQPTASNAEKAERIRRFCHNVKKYYDDHNLAKHAPT
jgi:hypothetical protein